MEITPEEYKKHEKCWERVLDTIIGLDKCGQSIKYHTIYEGFSKRYSDSSVERFDEIEYWIKARLFNKYYTELDEKG